MVQTGESPTPIPVREHPVKLSADWEQKWKPDNFPTTFTATHDENGVPLKKAKEVPVKMRRIELNRPPGTELTAEQKKDILEHGLQVAVNITGFGQSGQDISPSDNSFYESAEEEFAKKNKDNPLGAAFNVDLPKIPPKELGKTYRADAMVIEGALQAQVRAHLIDNLGLSPAEVDAMPCLYNNMYIESYSEGSGIALAFAQRVDAMQKEAQKISGNAQLPENKFVAFSPTNLLAIPGTNVERRFYMMEAFIKEVTRIAGYEVAERINNVDNMGFDLIKDKKSLVRNLVRLINTVHTPDKKAEILQQVKEAAGGSSTMLKQVVERASASPAEMGNQMQKFLAPNIEARNALGKNWNATLLLPAVEATGVDFKLLTKNKAMMEAALKELPLGPDGKPHATSIKKLLMTEVMTNFFANKFKVSPDEFRTILEQDYAPFMQMAGELFNDTIAFAKDENKKDESPLPTTPTESKKYTLAEKFNQFKAGAGTLGEISHLLLTDMGIENSILRKLAAYNQTDKVKKAAKSMPPSEKVANAPKKNITPDNAENMNELAVGLFPNAGEVNLVCFEQQTHTMIEEIPGVLKKIKDAIRAGVSLDSLKDIPLTIFFGIKGAAPQI